MKVKEQCNNPFIIQRSFIFMGGVLKLPLTSANIISIVLSGAFDGKSRKPETGKVVCDDLEEKVTGILFGERNKRLIRNNYHFVTEGASPYSEQVHRAIDFFHEVGILSYTMGEQGTNIHPKVIGFAEISRKQRRISRADYEFLINLGKELDLS